MAEMEARKLMWEKEDRELEEGENMGNLTGGSVLGQIHFDIAKYHEIQRFTKPDTEGYDKEAALFHLRHAADCGNLDAIITMARVALQLPHDVLTDLTMDESIENTDIGLDYMHSVRFFKFFYNCFDVKF
jgi:elongation factor 2 kinase